MGYKVECKSRGKWVAASGIFLNEADAKNEAYAWGQFYKSIRIVKA